jgi:hydroxyacylglutathione hydrolase
MAVILKQMEIGPMQNYQYFIGCDETRQVAIVDPAWDTDRILQEAETNQYQIVRILLTHGHSDHTEGAGRLSEALGIPVIISADEAPFYLPECPDLRTVHDHDRIPIGKINLECLSTPGHTPGCMCFKCGDILLTGDTLFVSGCGRCDLPGGDAAQMYHSLYDVILKLPDSTRIYPGHRYGPSSSADLKSLRQSNAYLTCRTKEEFLATRMGD